MTHNRNVAKALIQQQAILSVFGQLRHNKHSLQTGELNSETDLMTGISYVIAKTFKEIIVYHRTICFCGTKA